MSWTGAHSTEGIALEPHRLVVLSAEHDVVGQKGAAARSTAPLSDASKAMAVSSTAVARMV